MHGLGINYGVYTTAKTTRFRIEIDTTEIIVKRVELVIALRECASSTKIKRTSVSGENGIGLINRVLLKKRRKQQLIFLDIIDLKVGGGIEDLDTVAVSTMEQLTRSIS